MGWFTKNKKTNTCCDVKIEEVKQEKNSCCKVKIQEVECSLQTNNT